MVGGGELAEGAGNGVEAFVAVAFGCVGEVEGETVEAFEGDRVGRLWLRVGLQVDDVVGGLLLWGEGSPFGRELGRCLGGAAFPGVLVAVGVDGWWRNGVGAGGTDFELWCDVAGADFEAGGPPVVVVGAFCGGGGPGVV